jgi:8-amino-7-oxononanoate synthase
MVPPFIIPADNCANLTPLPGLPPEPMVVQSATGAEVLLNGRWYVNFGGSSYLGLNGNKVIGAAGISALEKCGAGMPLARSQNVETEYHRLVETRATEFFGSDAALFLASGSIFGLAALQSLPDDEACIFYDEFSHYSLGNAILASGHPRHSYSHLDAGHLVELLKRFARPRQRAIVVTDGLFSTFGEIAPLADLAEAMSPYAGRIIVDESHAFGVLGRLGRGAAEHHRLGSEAIIGGSLAKAFGVCGGLILGDAVQIGACRASQTVVGASYGMPAAAAMAARSLEWVAENPQLRSRLQANTAYLKAGLRRIGLDVGDTVAPIVTFAVGSPSDAAKVRSDLLSRGIFVYQTTYVGAGEAGVLRCAIFADHRLSHLDQLIEALGASL